MSKFTETPYFILLEYFRLLSDPTEPDEPILNGASLSSSYLGLPNNIIVKGGNFVDFYIKDDAYGFRPIRFIPDYNEPKEKIFFKFYDFDKQVLVPGSSITETLSGTPTVSGDYTYVFEIYDHTYETETNPDNHLAKEIYFRKDSPFYYWLNNSAYFYFLEKLEYKFSIRNLINTDKTFLYFGSFYVADKV